MSTQLTLHLLYANLLDYVQAEDVLFTTGKNALWTNSHDEGIGPIMKYS